LAKEEHNIFIESFSTILHKFLEGFTKNIVENLTKKVIDSERKILEMLISYGILFFGVIIITVAVIKLVNEYLYLSWGWSMLVIGLILVIWSLFLKKNAEV